MKDRIHTIETLESEINDLRVVDSALQTALASLKILVDAIDLCDNQSLAVIYDTKQLFLDTISEIEDEKAGWITHCRRDQEEREAELSHLNHEAYEDTVDWHWRNR